MSPHKRPKIGLIFTGGGIAARKDSKSSEMLGVYDFNEWMLEVSEINLIAEIKPINLFSMPGYEVGSDHWLKIAKTIYNDLDNCDGFVVTHGLDTIIYTATAVSFLLRDLGKPVIFTGSRFSPNQEDSDFVISNNKKFYKNMLGSMEARSNLINAVQAATMDLGEVCLLFGSKLLRANRATIVNLFGRDVFDTMEVCPLGKVHFGLDLEKHRIKRKNTKMKLFTDKIENKVDHIKIFPNMEPYFIERLVENDCRGLVLEPFFMGEFSSRVEGLLRKAVENKIPLVAARAALRGSINFDLYPGGKFGKELGIISAKDMTVEAALVKLMVILGKEKNLEKVRKLMLEDWAGEISD